MIWQEKQARQGTAPLRVPDWQGRQAAKKASPPAGAGTARSAGDQPGKPPAGDMDGRNCKCRKRFNAGVPGAEPPAK